MNDELKRLQAAAVQAIECEGLVRVAHSILMDNGVRQEFMQWVNKQGYFWGDNFTDRYLLLVKDSPN